MNVLRTPLTALAVTVKFNSNGRHVGLDFYDLLIEAGDTLGTLFKVRSHSRKPTSKGRSLP
jgi:hypothetical protein